MTDFGKLNKAHHDQTDCVGIIAASRAKISGRRGESGSVIRLCFDDPELTAGFAKQFND